MALCWCLDQQLDQLDQLDRLDQPDQPRCLHCCLHGLAWFASVRNALHCESTSLERYKPDQLDNLLLPSYA